MIRRILARSEPDLVRAPEYAPRDTDPASRRAPRIPRPAPAAPDEHPPAPRSQPIAPPATSVRRSLARDLSTRDGVRRAFLLMEILGSPLGLRDQRDPPGGP